jgi:hypothetical protein
MADIWSAARDDICARLDAITAGLPARQLAGQINEIRKVAADCGLLPVELLARGLESALAMSDGGIQVRPFLEAMRDAACGERVDPAAAQSYLACVNQRLYG